MFGCNHRSAFLTKEEFANAYMTALSNKYPSIKFKLNQDLTIISNKEGKDYQHFIDNAYIEYQAEPDSVQGIISRYVASTADLYIEHKGIHLQNVVPTIKSVASITEIDSLSAIGKTPTLVTKDYNEHLKIVYAEDSEHSIRYLTKENFKELNISEDSLFHVALKNLDSILPAIERSGSDGLYMITAGGNYESSLLLITSLWKKDKFPVSGDFIVAIPNRDMLLVTGSNNQAGIDKIREITAESYTSGNYPISNHLFRWSGKLFVEYE
jgi:uncharacterized protein YtpQ (UPF0354 family)